MAKEIVRGKLNQLGNSSFTSRGRNRGRTYASLHIGDKTLNNIYCDDNVADYLSHNMGSNIELKLKKMPGEISIGAVSVCMLLLAGLNTFLPNKSDFTLMFAFLGSVGFFITFIQARLLQADNSNPDTYWIVSAKCVECYE